MLYKFSNEKIEAEPFFDCTQLKEKAKEKDLENLLASQLRKIFVEDDLLMTIFQEHQGQASPDICALDREGNLVIFELKTKIIDNETTIQIMRYAQSFGQKSYSELNKMYNSYQKEQQEKNTEMQCELAKAHKQAFCLDHPLPPDRFNNKQKLILVGNSSNYSLIRAVNYWQGCGLNIDFIPYRFYDIKKEIYFEFFTKPYDFHLNPKDKKAIIFDTNKSYDKNSVWEMLNEKKVSAYGGVNYFVDRFNEGDIVLYYHKGLGIIAAGEITSSMSQDIERNKEKYRTVQIEVPTFTITSETELKYISPRELTELTGKNFYYASTIKAPYLSIEEANKIINLLKEKYKIKKK